MGIKSKIKSTQEIVHSNGIKILVHGPAKAGKTRLCATTGNLAHTLIISAEAGLLSLREYDIPAIEVKSLPELREVYSYLQRGDHDYRWICLDSISEIAEVVLAAEKGRSKDARQAYGEMADIMFAVLRKFRDLPCNVVMTAKQGREEDNGRLLYVPLLPGRQLTQNIAYLFDEVFALRVAQKDDGTLARRLQTARDTQYEAGDRSGALKMYEPANLKHIHDKIMAATLGAQACTERSRSAEPASPVAGNGAEQ